MSLENPSAPPGKSGKYARPELERRFLLAGMLPGKIERTAEITDRYLDGTRLRLRRMIVRTAEGDARAFYKLTQKVPLPQGGPGLITTVYLSEDEHERLATVPALVLAKTRFSIPPFGVDAFGPPREGLLLAEAEFESHVEMHSFAVPSWAIAEVTNDPRFSGGCLVATGRAEIVTLLRGFGIALEPSGNGP